MCGCRGPGESYLPAERGEVRTLTTPVLIPIFTPVPSPRTHALGFHQGAPGGRTRDPLFPLAVRAGGGGVHCPPPVATLPASNPPPLPVSGRCPKRVGGPRSGRRRGGGGGRRRRCPCRAAPAGGGAIGVGGAGGGRRRLRRLQQRGRELAAAAVVKGIGHGGDGSADVSVCWLGTPGLPSPSRAPGGEREREARGGGGMLCARCRTGDAAGRRQPSGWGRSWALGRPAPWERSPVWGSRAEAGAPQAEESLRLFSTPLPHPAPCVCLSLAAEDGKSQAKGRRRRPRPRRQECRGLWPKQE